MRQGRALISLDVTTLHAALRTLLPDQPLPMDFVDNYLKAFYLPPEQILDWAKAHPEYAVRHLSGNRKIHPDPPPPCSAPGSHALHASLFKRVVPLRRLGRGEWARRDPQEEGAARVARIARGASEEVMTPPRLVGRGRLI